MHQNKLKEKPIRLVKLISHAGFCSRREAEKLIDNGEVFFDNKPYKNFIIEPKFIKKITIKGKTNNNIGEIGKGNAVACMTIIQLND